MSDKIPIRTLLSVFLVIVAGSLGACHAENEQVAMDSNLSARGSEMKTGNRLEIVGHRGAKGIAPENTLASFQAAVDIGVDMIELDVHLSKDGELVVIHDPNLERTTDGSGFVGDLTLAQLRELDAAAKFDGDASYGVQHIPTLQEVYDLVDEQCRVNIEIKMRADGSRYADIERKVVDFLRENDAISSTVISSFDFPTLQQIQELEPHLECYAIVSTDYFREMGLKGKRANDVVDDLLVHGFHQVAVNKEFLSQDLTALLDQAGFLVTAWIVNDVDEMWQYANRGIGRITTDRPDLLIPAYRSETSGP
jgi:glycerophosphoryl diester phosphodiesterase